MQHRPVIGAAKTGTISRREARGAARSAKKAKKSSSRKAKGVALSVDTDGHRSSYFRSLFGPATGEPEEWSSWDTKPARKSTKRSAKKSTRKSAKKATAKKSHKRAAKSYR